MAEKSVKSNLQTASSAPSDPGDPQDEFLAILNNRGKADPGTGPAREGGFVVVTEGTPSLQFLQSLCHSEGQSYNTCFTARYRLGPGPVIGTLLAAFLADLGAVQSGVSSEGPAPDLRGDLLPPPGPERGETSWSRLFEAVLTFELRELANLEDVLSWDVAYRTFGALGDSLGTGQRLVLFCELPEHRRGVPDESQRMLELAREWAGALPLLASIPQRMGIVFGLPDDYAAEALLMEGPPHHTRLSFSGDAAAESESVQRFKPAALAGDYAATRDAFGFDDEARAIARLILHPQTEPMTISIEAPWGQGKSSFLNFVSRALTEVAAERVDPKLGAALKVVEDAASTFDRGRVGFSRRDSSELDEDRDRREESLRQAEERYANARRQEGAIRAQMDRVAQRDVLQVRFNAWRHQDATHIWAGLVSEVSKAVEKSLPRWRRWIAPLTYAFRNRASELFVGIVLPTILAIVAALTLTFFGVTADSQDLDGVPTIFKFLVPGSAVVAVLAWRVYRVLQPVSQRVLDYVRLPDYRDQLGFQEQVLQDLGYLRGLLRRRRLVWRGRRPGFEHRDPRIVVFIDDLDRCPDDKVMEVLQTVNLVLVQGGDADAGSKGSHGAFVLLAVDTDKIHQAIEHHYEKQGARTADPNFARSYLRKIIQLPYYLPKPAQGRRLSLVQGLFTPFARAWAEDGASPLAVGAPRAWEPFDEPEADGFPIAQDAVLPPRVQVFTEVEDTPAEYWAFRVLAEFLPDNPREMKRLLNVHRFVKILLQRPEAPPDDALQLKLVAWLIFSARWEELVDDVIRSAHGRGAPLRDALEPFEERDEMIGRFRGKVEGKLRTSLTAKDLAPEGILAQAALRTRLVPSSRP